jgi:GNAT superfamily N-acetyltransferase
MEARLEQPFIAYLEGKPVGTVSPLLDRESECGRLDGGVHVLPECRRQRIGTALLVAALNWLKNNGMKEAWVTPWNPEGELAIQRAIAFYLSNGGTIREE